MKKKRAACRQDSAVGTSKAAEIVVDTNKSRNRKRRTKSGIEEKVPEPHFSSFSDAHELISMIGAQNDGEPRGAKRTRSSSQELVEGGVCHTRAQTRPRKVDDLSCSVETHKDELDEPQEARQIRNSLKTGKEVDVNHNERRTRLQKRMHDPSSTVAEFAESVEMSKDERDEAGRTRSSSEKSGTKVGHTKQTRLERNTGIVNPVPKDSTRPNAPSISRERRASAGT